MYSTCGYSLMSCKLNRLPCSISKQLNPPIFSAHRLSNEMINRLSQETLKL